MKVKATENTENTEKIISTKIDTVINQWFQETMDKINNEIKTNTNTLEDILCPSILPLSFKYCNAALTLLNNNFKLPAMALIQILAEITLRLCWCLYGDNPQKESTDVRAQRWLKQSCKEQQKFLKKLLPSFNANKKKINEQISYFDKKIAEIPYESAGNLYGSLDELNVNLKNDLYPLLYSTFNTAIHPDLLLLSNLIKKDKNKYTFSGDFDDIDSNNIKFYVMTCAFWIVSLVRISYKWDYNDIKAQYLEIKKIHENSTKE
ncbi:MAG: hypothetical protein CVV39_03985 [Planctomycetes bacterium HGW-Planctomycetes-1]|nr:MAG: hypothetical protein CVV39_03985 [Planctomycetes bacterium HGW-Planctomycetes-1]